LTDIQPALRIQPVPHIQPLPDQIQPLPDQIQPLPDQIQPLPDIVQTIRRFLESSRDPVLSDPGQECIAIGPENFVVEVRGACAQLQAWDEKRNLVRSITAVERETRGKLVLRVARFGKLAGTLDLIDRSQGNGDNVQLRTARLGFREQFRLFLRRQFPAYKLVELTTEADLEHSLSPAYPRALLRQGASAWAAIGVGAGAVHPDGVLTFGLIWLDYLRRREPALAIHGLILYLPAGSQKTSCLRLMFLDSSVAHYSAFVYDQQGLEEKIDLRDCGNLDTHLAPYRRSLARPTEPVPGAETIDRGDGQLSLRVHGLEFARFGSQDPNSERRSRLSARRVAELSRVRSPDALDRRHPLYLRNPEAWLESQVRAHIQEIEASLLAAPIYGQVPAFAAADRGVLDLLAIDASGRLAVIELKASEDVHLPLQALDYWMRVAWHVEQGDFQRYGYFPGHELRPEPPRLLLVSPALDFHSSNERILRYLSPQIPVERLGVGLEWRKELKVMYRSSAR
jgi:hypothetical protein